MFIREGLLKVIEASLILAFPNSWMLEWKKHHSSNCFFFFLHKGVQHLDIMWLKMQLLWKAYEQMQKLNVISSCQLCQSILELSADNQ